MTFAAGINVQAAVLAMLIAGLIVNIRLVASCVVVTAIGLARRIASPRRATAEANGGNLPPEMQAALQEGSAWYVSFGWKAKVLIALLAVFTAGRSSWNRAAISLSLVGGFFRSVHPTPDGSGVGTNAICWAQEASKELRHTFGVGLFSWALAVTLIDTMTQADTSRLFKGYFQIRQSA